MEGSTSGGYPCSSSCRLALLVCIPAINELPPGETKVSMPTPFPFLPTPSVAGCRDAGGVLLIEECQGCPNVDTSLIGSSLQVQSCLAEALSTLLQDLRIRFDLERCLATFRAFLDWDGI